MKEENDSVTEALRTLMKVMIFINVVVFVATWFTEPVEFPLKTYIGINIAMLLLHFDMDRRRDRIKSLRAYKGWGSS